MQKQDTRSTIIFVVLSAIILFGYQFLIAEPQARKLEAQQKAQKVAEALAPKAAIPGAHLLPVAQRGQALSQAARVPVETDRIKGSISLTGGRLDDLYLKDFNETVAKTSGAVELLRPQGVENAYFAELGWVGQNLPGVPGAKTVWTLKAGETLSVGHPVTLSYDNGQGLVFTRTISVDDQYMFTVDDQVTNTTKAPVSLRPYGTVQRQNIPADLGHNPVVHEGAIGIFGDKLEQVKYKDWAKKKEIAHTGTGGWLGITDKYWLTALIPSGSEKVEGNYRVTEIGKLTIYETGYVGQTHQIAPGATLGNKVHVFAGAKRAEVLQAYQKQLKIPRFDMAIDWGMFWFFTRPIFWMVEQLYHLVGNFGIAILALTVIVKAVFFPIAHRSYESMVKIRKLQPQMEAIKTKFKDDPQKQQVATMELYQKEKINPVAGCLPMLAQIPVFFSLYKVLAVTIEMRHAAFFGWLNDLSARDSTTLVNLFGLLPFTPASVPMIGGFLDGPLHIGILALIYAGSMWLQTRLSPQATDPVQKQIFALMPIMYLFIGSSFASGLLVYWIWSNVLGIAQQYAIMNHYKVENPIDTFLESLKAKKV